MSSMGRHKRFHVAASNLVIWQSRFGLTVTVVGSTFTGQTRSRIAEPVGIGVHGESPEAGAIGGEFVVDVRRDQGLV